MRHEATVISDMKHNKILCWKLFIIENNIFNRFWIFALCCYIHVHTVEGRGRETISNVASKQLCIRCAWVQTKRLEIKRFNSTTKWKALDLDFSTNFTFGLNKLEWKFKKSSKEKTRFHKTCLVQQSLRVAHTEFSVHTKKHRGEQYSDPRGHDQTEAEGGHEPVFLRTRTWLGLTDSAPLNCLPTW